MNDFMMQLAHASFQGGVIIAVIFALRFALKKAPKSILCLLWLLAITRLLLPIQLESSLSLQPDIEIITQQEYQQPESLVQTPSQQVPAVPMETIQIGDGEIIHPIYSDSIITPEQPAVFDWASVLPWIWLSVAVGLALWSILSYLRLRNRTKSAIVLDEGIWLSPELDSAFVLGYLKPQIYLPAKLNKQEQTLVISHERAHIRRFDHWYKLLGFITLCVHWFNPLVWLAYIFLCRDMEMACDEQVVRDMDTQQRKAYSMALLRCSADNHHFKPCPVAFAEISVKDRIKGVLNYKKPGFWMTLVGIVAVVFVAVCFLTSPVIEDDATKMTRLCREAVEAIQNADSYRLTEKQFFIRTDEDFVGLAYETAESVRSGEDWLRKIVTPDFTNYFLLLNGQELVKYESNAVPPEELAYSDWTAALLSKIETCHPSWLEELNWDQHEIIYLSHDALSQGQLSVSFTADAYPSVENAGRTAFVFVLDEDSQLVSATRTITSQAGTTSVIIVEAVNDPAIDRIIDACYLEAGQSSPDELRQKCIDIQQMLYNTAANPGSTRPIHLRVVRNDKYKYDDELIYTPSMQFKRTIHADADLTQEWCRIVDGGEAKVYERHYNTSMSRDSGTGWVLSKYQVDIGTSIQYFSPENLQNTDFGVKTDSSGLRCAFEISDEFGRSNTYTYHFGPGGALVSITELFTYADGSNSITTSILSTSADEIIANLTSIYAEITSQSPKPTIPVQPDTQAILDAVNQHLAFRDAILLGDITEIAEMDLALLKDELKHKQAVAADALKRLGSEYAVTEITLNKDGSANALVTETVTYEIDGKTLGDNTADELIVHILKLEDVNGSFRVVEDAYREELTDFISQCFDAEKLKQTQERIVTKAIDQYFSWKKEVLAEGVTMIPEMEAIWLKEKLRHKQHLDNAGIQWIDSSYTIQEIKFWDREYADILLAETVTYSINGEIKQETIQHEMGVVGVQGAAQVCGDAYFEEFSDFRSNDYIGATIFPD